MENEAREIRTPNLLIWSQTRYRCTIAPMVAGAEEVHHRKSRRQSSQANKGGGAAKEEPCATAGQGGEAGACGR